MSLRNKLTSHKLFNAEKLRLFLEPLLYRKTERVQCRFLGVQYAKCEARNIKLFFHSR